VKTLHFFVLKERTNGTMAANATLPTFAVINYAVRRNRDGSIKTIDEPDDPSRRGVLQFHANMKPSTQALLLYDIQATKRCVGLATIYTAKFVDPTNAASGNVATVTAPPPAAASHRGAGVPPKTALFFLHGFNSNPTGVFNGWRKYQNRNPNREVVPVLWADHQWSIFGYTPDKVYMADPAARAFSDLVDIANSWAFPRRSLVCHSMGNFVLRRLARYVAKTDGVNLAFDDIFMVAADVSDQVFDDDQNHVDPTRPASRDECDGLSILALATHQVHVLHSSKDWALKARVIPNCGGRALGARGYVAGGHANTCRSEVNASNVAKLTDINCSNNPRGGCIGHNYQFEGWAIDLYEATIAIRAAAAASQAQTAAVAPAAVVARAPARAPAAAARRDANAAEQE
jgi:esterase/lipase superfamily enzyme